MPYSYMFEAVDIRHDPLKYRDTVAARAAEGWRLVQILVETPAAMPSEYILILERTAEPA